MSKNKPYVITLKADFDEASGVNLFAYLRGMQGMLGNLIMSYGGEPGSLRVPRNDGDPALFYARMPDEAVERVKRFDGVTKVEELKR